MLQHNPDVRPTAGEPEESTTHLLFGVGFGVFVLYSEVGFDKVSFVVSGFFGLASILSVLRQMGAVKLDVEVPVLVLAAGVLLIAARSEAIPLPRWIQRG